MSDITTKHAVNPYTRDLVAALRTAADVALRTAADTFDRTTNDLQAITQQLNQIVMALIQMIRALDDEVRR